MKQGYLKLMGETLYSISIDEGFAVGKTEFLAICMRYLSNETAVKCCTKMNTLL